MEIPILLILIIILALIYDYTNGAHDCACSIATVISTKVISPKLAVILASILNFVGAFLGTSVANTISKGIVHPEMVYSVHSILLAALLSAIIWNFFTWFIGLPTSSSHALIGGLIGAGVVVGGWASLDSGSILEKIILPLFMSPISGFIAGYLFLIILSRSLLKMKYRTGNRLFKKLQIVSASFMAISHGMNDAQKTMGIISLALFQFGIIPALYIPLWVKIVCALAIFLGTMNGGWEIIKTIGHKIFKMDVLSGFGAQTSTALVTFIASLIGAPISATQVISSSVLGVGASKRFSSVRWNVAKNMIVAWFDTIPAAACIGAVLMYIFILINI